MHSRAECGSERVGAAGVVRQAVKCDLVVIIRENLFIIFQRRLIVALWREAATLRRPFIFLLRLCA